LYTAAREEQLRRANFEEQILPELTLPEVHIILSCQPRPRALYISSTSQLCSDTGNLYIDSGPVFSSQTAMQISKTYHFGMVGDTSNFAYIDVVNAFVKVHI
jgi:hypothetical protein